VATEKPPPSFLGEDNQMGRQYRSPRAKGAVGDGVREFVGPVPGSSVVTLNLGAAHTIPSYGVTDISTWAASTYLMAPPTQGCMKTILHHGPTSAAGAARTIKLSTDNSVTVRYCTPTTGTAGNTHILIGNATADVCLTLMGVNSTHWIVYSVFPVTTASSVYNILST
jgi:hypothetical protein